ncbi:MAG: hypothetical protein U9M98_02420 [Patescibacteria group bacterium]|nr:hypothetical protein [Patescibacteria group bacterium]
MSNYFVDLNYDKSKLAESEQKVLGKLVDAAKLIGILYSRQEDNNHPGANFYPHNASREEIRAAAEEDPAILSPYTMVKRGEKGNLVAIPYHKMYSEEMEKIATLLEEAAKASEDREFAEFLKLRAQSFRDGSWDKSEDKWLEMNGHKIDIVIGPIEPYLDDLFSIKCAFQANIRVTSNDPKFNPQDYLKVIRNLYSSCAGPSEEERKPVKVRVDDVVALAGWHAKLRPVGSNLPNDPEKVEKYGTKIIIYTDNIRYREGKITIGALERVFPKDIVEEHSRESLLDNAIRGTMLHEITEAIVKYPGTVNRLGDMYTPVKELHATIVGLKGCTFHVLKGILTQKDFKELLMILISWLFESWLRRESSKGIRAYLRGYMVAFNFFREQDALEVKDGVIKPDFEELFLAVDNLAGVLSHLMSEGTQEEAEEFFAKYEDYQVMDQFTSELSALQQEL